MNFNPRSPRGERLERCQTYSHLPHISIHAPLAGSDRSENSTRSVSQDFNPRSPRGERRHIKLSALGILAFQSTLPSRGATGGVLEAAPVRPISIHAPLAGSDAGHGVPGLPAGHSISIHAPLAGSDVRAGDMVIIVSISIHAPLAGSDLKLIRL